VQSVCIVGGGVSGLAWAHVLGRLGFSATVFERERAVGGQWVHAYPHVTLQNTSHEYAFPDFPWPFDPERHPTGEQILAYFESAVAGMKLDVKCGHEVVKAERDEAAGKWRVTVRPTGGSPTTLEFDKLVVSIGQYTDRKRRPAFPGESSFQGEILTERDVKDLDAVFAPGRRVAVVGFGKSALDMATFAASNGATVHHVFRRARWALPQTIFGLHFTYLLFSRANGTVLMPAWDHPTAAERFVHAKLGFVVNGFWGALQTVVRFLARRAARGLGPEAAARVELALPPPDTALTFECRSAIALAPVDYHPQIARGEIEPVVAGFEGFAPDGRSVVLRTEAGVESTIENVDVVVLALGSESPAFPFLPEHARAELEADRDGVQLFRHIVAPTVYPDSLAFAGFNHGFLHIPSAWLGALWAGALWRGDFALPPVETMQACVERVRAWKREHILFEPSRSCAINTRFQQYNDMLCIELGLSPHRKMPNVLAEALGRYGASDYRGIVDEYLEHRRYGDLPTIDWNRFTT
jgi:cation diffusion facilitator CzcD-associated flavoprotein CzcO